MLYFGDDNWLVPEPTWTLRTFLTQCAADPDHTQGAFVVGLDSAANLTRDHFFSRSAYVDITAHILYAQCNMQVAQASVNDPSSKTSTGPKRNLPLFGFLTVYPVKAQWIR